MTIVSLDSAQRLYPLLEAALKEQSKRPSTIRAYLNALHAYLFCGRVGRQTPAALRAVQSLLPPEILADLPRVEKEHQEVLRRARLRAMTRPPAEVPPLDVLVRRASRRPRDLQLALYLGLYAGLRRGDMVRLTWQDVLPDSIVLRDPKGGRPYSVPIARPLRSVLDRARRIRRPAPGDRVLLNEDSGLPLSPERLSQLFRSHLGIHPHYLRRYFATRLLRSGVPIVVVARLLNHKNINTTYLYATPSIEDLQATLNEVF